MPERLIIADTGPVVAFLTERDVNHDWAVEQFRTLPAPFLTCEPVLVETFHLLRRYRRGLEGYFRLLESEMLLVEFQLMPERDAIWQLVSKYVDLPMSLADACLVRMTEQHPEAVALTIDSHFHLYRKQGRQRIETIMPETAR